MYDQQIAMTQNETSHIARRLTPLECCRLQGFPDYWVDGLGITKPPVKSPRKIKKRWRKEFYFWWKVFETHRLATNPDKKQKTHNWIKKWLANPRSDSAEYKTWGNSLAIPCAYNILAGIAEEIRKEEGIK